MKRRDFLKSTVALGTLAAVTAKVGWGGIRPAFAAGVNIDTDGKITRRRYKDTNLTMPLLGYGMMRLPVVEGGGAGDVDADAVQTLVDRAMAAGLNHFDTAYMYNGGQSERFIGRALKKYPRNSFTLTDKLPVMMMNGSEDAERIFNEQLEKTQAGYFDFYLLHALNADTFEKAEKWKLYEFLEKKKEEGKIRHIGFSFHDRPEILERIAASHKWDVVLLQINYLDWELYRSSEQYEIATKHGIPVMVMEPLRGGMLAKLNEGAAGVLKQAAPDASTASWAFRYVASLPNVLTILSGMTYSPVLENNIKTFTPLKPLDTTERQTLANALAELKKSAGFVPCTGCRYCSCPFSVDIPELFAAYNSYILSNKTDGRRFKQRYNALAAAHRADKCVKCRSCVPKCPQHIDIPAELAKVAQAVKELG